MSQEQLAAQATQTVIDFQNALAGVRSASTAVQTVVTASDVKYAAYLALVERGEAVVAYMQANPGGGGGTVGPTWDAANKSAGVELSENAVRMTVAGNDAAAKSIVSYTEGKRYFEVQVVTLPGSVGVGNPQASVESWVGSDAYSRGIDPATGITYVAGNSEGATGTGAFALLDVIGIAINFTVGKMWFSKNGVFPSGQDPVANVGGFNIPGAGGLSAMVAAHANGSFRLRTAAGQFSNSIPSGYSA